MPMENCGINEQNMEEKLKNFPNQHCPSCNNFSEEDGTYLCDYIIENAKQNGGK